MQNPLHRGGKGSIARLHMHSKKKEGIAWLKNIFKNKRTIQFLATELLCGHQGKSDKWQPLPRFLGVKYSEVASHFHGHPGTMELAQDYTGWLFSKQTQWGIKVPVPGSSAQLTELVPIYFHTVSNVTAFLYTGNLTAYLNEISVKVTVYLC